MVKDLFPIDWSVFHFLRPQLLWLLIPLLLAALTGILAIRREAQWTKIIPPHLRPFVIRKGNDRVKVLMNVVLVFALGFGVLALSGPTWKKVEMPGQELETPMVIILDLSQSMMATDLQPNRLERAKFKVHDLLKQNPQARAALIAFAGTAHTVVPLTKDYEIILSHIDGLSPDMMPLRGSNLGAALTLADTVTNATAAPGTVIIFSDDFEEGTLNLLQQFTENTGHKVTLVPVNTRQGSEVPAESGKGSITDRQGHIVFSSLDEDLLSRLASLDRVKVSPLTLDDSDMELISMEISQNLIFKTQPEEKKDNWQDVGLLLAFPMAFLLLFWFRKGWVVYVIPLFLITSCSDDSGFSDLWFTPDYQGQRLMNKGDYTGSAGQFADPLRKGVAFYKAGDFENAIAAFKKDTTSMGAYNLGLAYFNNGDTAAAMSAFGVAAELDPDFAPAREAQQQLEQLLGGESEINPEDAQEAQPKMTAENMQNMDMEDLSGGGQEATEEDMEKERKEETLTTDIRKGKELDEVPEEMEAVTQQQDNSKILMRKVDDDPAQFLKRKFEFQVKKAQLKLEPDAKRW